MHKVEQELHSIVEIDHTVQSKVERTLKICIITLTAMGNTPVQALQHTLDADVTFNLDAKATPLHSSVLNEKDYS